MANLTYKTFTWPQNPHTYHDCFVREPRYLLSGEDTVFGGMSAKKRTITGEGVFFGPNAYTQFLQLVQIFEDAQPGTLTHPIWGSCNCYLTRLELTQEPRDHYVSYRFTFTGALSNGEVPR